MRKRICNKVLLKFISVGAFLGGGGGKRIGKLPFSHAFFLGVGKGMGKFSVSHAFLGGGGDGEVACLASFFWGGGWGGWGRCLSNVPRIKAICTSPLRTKGWSDSQLDTGNIFSFKSK